MLPTEEYEKLRQEPTARHIMYQRWRSLLFLHFSADPEKIAPLLPRGLELDTFDGKAWVGLVPFRMEGVRARYLPGWPGHTNFCETNVRTYVHRRGREPGVWFFSLDAGSRMACRVARKMWGLPYHHAELSIEEHLNDRIYACDRLEGAASNLIEARVYQPMGAAKPGSLEFFLVERYLLYAHRHESLWKGRVYHQPYPLYSAEVRTSQDALIRAAGIEPQPFDHVLYSPGVDVKVYGLEKC